MALLRSFCFCCNVRTGSMFSAIYSLLASCVYIGLIMIRYVGYRYTENAIVYETVTYSTFAVFGVLAATAAVLIYAVYTDQSRLYIPWLLMLVLTIMYGTGTAIWCIIAQLRYHQDMHPWEICILLTHILNSTISIYCLLCVFSQYQDLSRGKGTSQYYRRRQGIVGETVPSSSFVCEHTAGVSNIGLSLDDVPPSAATLQHAPSTNSLVAPPSYCEAPPAYSTLPREFEQQLEQTTPFYISGTAAADLPPSYTIHRAQGAAVHSPPHIHSPHVHSPLGVHAPPGYLEALRHSQRGRLPPPYRPTTRSTRSTRDPHRTFQNNISSSNRNQNDNPFSHRSHYSDRHIYTDRTLDEIDRDLHERNRHFATSQHSEGAASSDFAEEYIYVSTGSFPV